MTELLQPDPAREVEVGDIVQIAPDASDWAGGCFAVVTEAKSWGMQGYVTIPCTRRGDVSSGGLAYIRLSKDKYVRVGRAEWMRAEDSEETNKT